MGLPRCVLSVPVSGAGVIWSTGALLTVATAGNFRTKTEAALIDSGLLSTLRAINCDLPKYGGHEAGGGNTVASRARLCPLYSGMETPGRA